MVILTNKEKRIIEKRIANKKLSQSDRNRLSRSIRPKLREMSSINSTKILEKIGYNPHSVSIENKIIKRIKENIEVDSIILYGSVIQTNYHSYNDIDIMIVTPTKLYKTEMEKWEKIEELKRALKKEAIVSDIEIISKENLIASYKNSPTLIYELKDHKIIYGNIKVPNKIQIYKIDLQMKLDWSELIHRPTGNEVYSALRNTLLVRLILNKVIDNSRLNQSLYDELGRPLIERLKNNQQSALELKYSINYLNRLIQDTEKQLGGDPWEKIEI